MATVNPFDQFDTPTGGGNPFDAFDTPAAPPRLPSLIGDEMPEDLLRPTGRLRGAVQGYTPQADLAMPEPAGPRPPPPLIGDETPEDFPAARPTGRLRIPSQSIPPRIVDPNTALGRGAKQGASAFAATSAAFMGGDVDAAASYIADVQRRLADQPQPESVRRFFESKGFGSSLKAFASDPLTISTTIMGESAGMFLPTLGLSGVSIAAGPAGPIVTAGTGSLALEAGGQILDSFAQNGVDLTDEKQIAAAFRNPQLMAMVRATALKKGIPIALFDALSMGIAGKLFSPVRKAVTGTATTLGRNVAGRAAGVGAELGAQAGLGMTGETAGQLVAGQDLSVPDILAEGIGEIAGAPGEIAVATGARQANPFDRFDRPQAAPQAAPEAAPQGLSPQARFAIPYPVQVGEARADVRFPDALHVRLYEHGRRLAAGENPMRLRQDARALFDAFRPWVVEDFRQPGDVNRMALDYFEAVNEETELAIRNNQPERLEAHTVVDPEREADFWRLHATGQIETGAVPTPPEAPPVVPTPPAPPQPSTQGPAPQGQARVFTPAGRAVDTAFELVEADTLVSSHTPDLMPNRRYPAELQPRDRTRAASQEQIATIAGNLRPEMLGSSPDATTGAPIVGPDGVVESGNARVLAIRRAHEQDLPGARAYRQWLESQGYSTEGMKNPVLVRRRTTQLSPEERIAFTREANQRTAAGMSASEQATTDAQAMPDALLGAYRGGDVTSAANRDFTRRFVETVIPEADRGAIYTAEGALSQEGIRRIENALYARAYEDAEGLAALREHPDTNFRAIGNAMVAAAPVWAQMRQQAAQGAIPPNLDITPSLKEAVALVRRARREGKKLSDLVTQRDLITGDVTPTTRAVLGLMFRDNSLARPASGQRVQGALTYYATEAMKAQPGPGLFGQAQASPLDILRLARQRGQQGLFPTDDLPGAAEMISLDRADASGDVLPEQANMGPGVNYTGFVRDTVAGTSRADPIRRESILGKLASDLGVPLYTGRIQSKKILGFFRRPIEEVRIKNPADIETAAHEYGHLLDHRFPEIRQQWTPATNANKTVRDELRGISYDASKLFEGFAEYMRLRLTQPAQAQAKAPTFHKWFESFLDRNQFGPAIREAEKGMTDWFGQDAISRARSKIGEPPEINEFLAPFWSRFRQAVSDDLHGIYRMERDLTGGIAPAGPYEVARLTRGAHAIVEGSLLYGAPVVNMDGSHSFKGKGLQAILDPVSDNLDDALLYFVGKSADELHRQGRERLFTRAEIDGMLSLRTNARETAFQEYQEWNKAILDFAQRKGIIDPAFRSQWRRAQYLPFHRVGQPGPGEAIPGAWSGIKALTGGSENLRDVLGNMIGNASMLIQAALTNEARLEVAKLAKKPSGAKFMAQIPSEDRHVKIHRLEIERAILEALGVKRLEQLDVERQIMVKEIIDGMSGMVWLTMKGQQPLGPDIVAVLHHGKPAFFQVADPILYRSLVGLNRPTKNLITRILSVPRRIGQASITLTLDFITANIIRDTGMGFVMSRHGFKPVVDSARGLKSRIATDQNYRDFIANGGGFASYLVDEDAFRAHLARFYRSKGISFDSVLHSPKEFLLGLERIADAFEMATRLGEFRQAIRRGEHPRHAAYSAREVSTDFGMRGGFLPRGHPGADVIDQAAATLGFLYDSIMFLKAGVNGMDRLYRGIAHDPNRVAIAAKTAAIAGASMALYAINAGNPLYDELEDWDKDTHWHIFIPNEAYFDFVRATGREPRTADEAGPLYVHLRLPKIWEVGAVASLAERSLGQAIDGNAGNFAEHAWRVVRDLFRFEYIPQAIAPAVEVAMNRNRFLDRPIETQSERDMQAWARSGPYSSRSLRWYGENVSRHMPAAMPDWMKSPKQVEALLRGYLNTWALYGLTAADAMFFDDMPDLRLDQYPGLRRFYRQHPARSTKYVTQLYDAIDESVKARRTMRFMDRTFRPELATEMEETAENRAYSQLQMAQRQMGAIRREMADVQDAPTLEAVQEIVKLRAFLPKSRNIVTDAKRAGVWNDLGALKRFLKDDLTAERNRYAREVMGELRDGRVVPFQQIAPPGNAFDQFDRMGAQ